MWTIKASASFAWPVINSIAIITKLPNPIGCFDCCPHELLLLTTLGYYIVVQMDSQKILPL